MERLAIMGGTFDPIHMDPVELCILAGPAGHGGAGDTRV